MGSLGTVCGSRHIFDSQDVLRHTTESQYEHDEEISSNHLDLAFTAQATSGARSTRIAHTGLVDTYVG